MNDTSLFERLEDRTLLAVTVGITRRGILTLTGDGAGDKIELEGTGNPGEVRVSINDAAPKQFLAVKTISGNLGAGGDTVIVSAINIGGSLDLKLGTGADTFIVDNKGDFHPAGAVFIGGNVNMNFGGDVNDDASWLTSDGFSISVGNNVTFSGVSDVRLVGNGATREPGEPTDINIGGALRITLSGTGPVKDSVVPVIPNADPDDELFLQNVNVSGVTVLIGSGAADEIRMAKCSFGGAVQLDLNGGNDRFDIDETGFNRFNSSLAINFGDGIDVFDTTAAAINPADDTKNYFGAPPVTGKRGPEYTI